MLSLRLVKYFLSGWPGNPIIKSLSTVANLFNRINESFFNPSIFEGCTFTSYSECHFHWGVIKQIVTS